MTPLDTITLQEAKDHLKVDFADDDALISRLIGVAVDLVEQKTQHYLFQRDKAISVTGCKDVYEYPFTAPESTAYSLTPMTLYSRLKVFSNEPTAITLTVGYESKTDIPAPLLEACYKLITYLYEHRDMQQATIPSDVHMLLRPYVRYATI